MYAFLSQDGSAKLNIVVHIAMIDSIIVCRTSWISIEYVAFTQNSVETLLLDTSTHMLDVTRCKTTLSRVYSRQEYIFVTTLLLDVITKTSVGDGDDCLINGHLISAFDWRL